MPGTRIFSGDSATPRSRRELAGRARKLPRTGSALLRPRKGFASRALSVTTGARTGRGGGKGLPGRHGGGERPHARSGQPVGAQVDASQSHPRDAGPGGVGGCGAQAVGEEGHTSVAQFAAHRGE